MASLAAIFKQVKRDGARWGLVPVMREGKVSVCELVTELTNRGGVEASRKVPRVVCSLDENSSLDAFSAVLMHRLKRQHYDFMKLVNNRKRRLRDIAQREIDQRRTDLRHKLEQVARRRQIFTGIGR